jgi:protein FAM32A
MKYCAFITHGKRRKKKSKSKAKDKDEDKEAQRLKELEAIMREEERRTESPVGSSRASPSVVSSDRKTAAEKRFEEVQRKRVCRGSSYLQLVLNLCMQLTDKVTKLATKTHKDRVNEFNSKLEALSEHHDIPKVHFCVSYVSTFLLMVM